LAYIALGAAMLGLGAATFHLGKPLKAWRAFLGWRTSWFSREVIAYGLFIFFAAARAVAPLLPLVGPLETPLALTAALLGLVAVGCSAMIYVDTRREFWSMPRCFVRFFGTTLLLGSAVAAFVRPEAQIAATRFVPLLVMVAVTKVAFEQHIFQ